MNLNKLLEWSLDKTKFHNIEDYCNFCEEYLSFIKDNIQAVIISQNETNYCFFQYKSDGQFNVTRPINSDLMISIDDFYTQKSIFLDSLNNIKGIKNETEYRRTVNNFIYTCQQSIGACLDALPSGKSNNARKLNGDLFEKFIRIIIKKIGIDVRDGIVKLPIVLDNGEKIEMSYQHDLILQEGNKVKAIGSVKTSSKDRIDKIFIDKFLYNKLTDNNIPHFAVFLNDVQRKGKEGKYAINATFLTGHFKGYTVKLNPMDGVYYCDMRLNMKTDKLLKENIKSLDNLFIEDILNFYD